MDFGLHSVAGLEYSAHHDTLRIALGEAEIRLSDRLMTWEAIMNWIEAANPALKIIGRADGLIL